MGQILNLHQAYLTGVTTPEIVIDKAISRVEERNSELHAFASLDYEKARSEAAQASDRYRAGNSRGVLDGVVVGLKDLFETAGIPTTAGSRILLDYVPTHDADVVKLLHHAGANTYLGKLNLHEFAYSPTGTSSQFGAMKNPHDPEKMAGGSSGGSAIAVATGMTAAALGTDTGGSVRIPAAFCGVYGLKPSYGRISARGVIPLSWTLDHVGPIASDLDDLEILWHTLSQKPEKEGTLPDTRQILWGTHEIWDTMDPAVTTRFGQAMKQIEERLEVSLRQSRLPRIDEVGASQQVIIGAEAANYHWAWLASRPDDYQEDVRERLTSRAGYLAVQYIEALRRRQELIDFYDNHVFDHYDFIMTPTVPISPPSLDTVVVNGMDVRQVLTGWTSPFNLLGLPALTIPLPPAAQGIGLQIVGPRFGENGLIAFAHSVDATLQS